MSASANTRYGSLARFIFGRSWIPAHGQRLPHPDSAPLGPRSESREARTGPTNKTLGSAVAVSAFCRPKLPVTAGPASPQLWGGAPSAKKSESTPVPAESGGPAYQRPQISKPKPLPETWPITAFSTLAGRLWFGLGKANSSSSIPTERRQTSHALPNPKWRLDSVDINPQDL